MKLTTFILLATAATPTSSWGTDVHNQIGHLATALLSPSTTTLLTSLLSNTTLGAAASWADAYAHTPEGHFSYQWHWIDTHDNPPHTCSLDYKKDCAKGGCVVSAIGNQTRILTACVRSAVKDKSINNAGQTEECEKALKWLLHFVGDIHQPLHASGHAQGGNGINVTFNTLHTQLHAVYDSLLPHYIASLPPSTLFPTCHLAPYFSHLWARIKRDAFPTPVALWTTCIDARTPPEMCAAQWARESNLWTCDYVYKYLGKGGGKGDGDGDGDGEGDEDLQDNGYAEGARVIVEGRLARAGVRLAGLLERIVAEGRGEGQNLEL